MVLLTSTNNLCKQFRPRSGPTNVLPDLDPNCFSLWWYSWKNISKNWILTKVSRRQQQQCFFFLFFRSIDKGFHTENAITHVFEKAEPVPVPIGAAKLPVTVGNDIYMCTPYIYHKMKILRYVYTYMSLNMRFPTMWYVRPAQAQTSLPICAVRSEPLLVTWIFYEC